MFAKALLAISPLFISMIALVQNYVQQKGAPAPKLTAATYHILRGQARAAYLALNEARRNHNQGANCHSQLPAGPLLQWNDTLAKVAELKARAMAMTGHTGNAPVPGQSTTLLLQNEGYKLAPDLAHPEQAHLVQTAYSTLGTDDSGREVIRQLVECHTHDKAHPQRQHILGLSNMHQKNIDVGVGIVRREGDVYSTHICIVIARH